MKTAACKICKKPKPPPMAHIDNERWPKNSDIVAKLKNRGCVICRRPPFSLLKRKYEQDKQIWYDRNYRTIIKLSRALGQSADDVLNFLYSMTMRKFCQAVTAQDQDWQSCRVPLTESGNCDLYLGLFDVNGNLREPLQENSLLKLLELMQEAFDDSPLENSFEEHLSLFEVIGGGPKRNRLSCYGSCDPLGLCKRDTKSFYSIDGQYDIDEILMSSGLIDGIGQTTGFDEDNVSNERFGGSLLDEFGLNKSNRFGGEGRESGQSPGDHGDDRRGRGADAQGGLRENNGQLGGARGSRGGDGKGADRKGVDGRGGDGRGSDGRGSDGKGGDGRRGYGKGEDGKGGDGKGGDARRGDGKGGDGRRGDGKGGEGKGVDGKGGYGKGGEGKGTVGKGGAKGGDGKGGIGIDVDSNGAFGKVKGRNDEQNEYDEGGKYGKQYGRNNKEHDVDDKYKKRTEAMMRVVIATDKNTLLNRRKGSQIGDISDLYSKVAGATQVERVYKAKGEKKVVAGKPYKKYTATNRNIIGEQIPVLWHEPFDKTKPITWIRRHPEQLRVTASGDIDKGQIRRYRRDTINKELMKARKKVSVISTYNVDVSPSLQMFSQFGEPPAKKRSVTGKHKKN